MALLAPPTITTCPPDHPQVFRTNTIATVPEINLQCTCYKDRSINVQVLNCQANTISKQLGVTV